ncbi:MAG: hypothetical protein K2O08_05655, partial [Clostridia bacterium]|nr:hypothetical protein [Clostridia bacterium]
LMKKFITVISLLLIISLMSLTLVACGGDVDDSGVMTLVVKNGDDIKEYTVDLSEIQNVDGGKGVMVILEYLKNNDDLTYAYEESAYGAYLTQVNSLKQENGAYIYLYTDVESDIDLTEYPTTIDYNGKTLTNSGVGVSQMNVKDGCTILITTITFGN